MVERKVFPGYVLVKMVLNDDTHYMIRSIRGASPGSWELPPTPSPSPTVR